jgi:hypothetical protein
MFTGERWLHLDTETGTNVQAIGFQLFIAVIVYGWAYNTGIQKLLYYSVLRQRKCLYE